MDIVHIGLMKTGTTSIQNFLSANRAELYHQGFVYPGERLNHQSEVYGICGNDIYFKNKINGRDLDNAGILLEEIKKIKGAGKKVIFSSEALSTLNDQGVERFVSYTGKPEKVIVTVRSLYKTLPSAWQQHVKEGNVLSHEQFMQSFIKNRESLSGPWRTYSFGDIVRRWSRYCKNLSLIVVDDRAKKSDLLSQFSLASGFEDDGFEFSSSSSRLGNRSLS